MKIKMPEEKGEWYRTKITNATGDSDALIVPSFQKDGTFIIHGISNGSVSVQVSYNTSEELVADSNVVWYDTLIDNDTEDSSIVVEHTVRAIIVRAGADTVWSAEGSFR